MEKTCRVRKAGVVRLFILFMTALAVFSGFSVVIHAAESASWEGLQQAVNSGEEISVTLTQDIVAPENSEPIRIKTGKNVTLDLNGHTLSRNFSKIHDNGHVLVVQKDAVLTVIDSSGNDSGKITGGYSKDGGGIYVNGTLNFEGGTIADNNASQYGGGIYAPGGTVNISGGVITNNKAESSGGAVYSNGRLTMENCTVKENRAKNNGGGIFANEKALLNITGGTVDGNESSSGAGIFLYKVSANISGVGFTGNKATNEGGAVFSINSILEIDVKPEMENCTFKQNSAESGGGLALYSGAHLKNCIIEGNEATGDGGGVRVGLDSLEASYEQVRFDGTDFRGNTASNGGGVFANGKGELVLHDCTVNDNHAENNAGGVMADGVRTALIGAVIDQNSAKNYCGGITVVDSIVSMKGQVIIKNNGSYGKYKVFDDMMLDGNAYISNPGLYSGSYIHLGNKYIAGETVYVKDVSKYQMRYFHIDSNSVKFTPTSKVKTPVVASLFGGTAATLAIVIATALIAIGIAAVIIKKKKKPDKEETETETEPETEPEREREENNEQGKGGEDSNEKED